MSLRSEPRCAGCGAPAPDHLTLHYTYPRESYEPLAADPWNVQGSGSLRSCGSPACGASALLAALDEVVTDVAFHFGRLIDREDVRVVEVGHPGDLTYFVVEDGEES